MVALRMFILSTVLIFSSLSRADVLFEGYSKILLGGSHVGYTISRYEFEPKKQEFVSTYFIRLDAGDLKFSESLKARANSKLEPISYFYTRLDGEPAAASPGKAAKKASEIKTIDAYFQKSAKDSFKMSAVVHENGKTQTIKKDLPKGTFLSTFLYYLILQSKNGIEVNAKYPFEAIAEEDASLAKGDSVVSAKTNLNGVEVYKIINNFKDDLYYSYVTPKGEIIATESPARKLSTQLVPDMKDAIGGLGFKPATLESLFGSVPKGKENVLARNNPTDVPAPSPKLNVSAPEGKPTPTASAAPVATPTGKPKK